MNKFDHIKLECMRHFSEKDFTIGQLLSIAHFVNNNCFCGMCVHNEPWDDEK